MPVPTSWRDGYRRETTFGTSLITEAGSAAYKLGMLADDQPTNLPSPVPVMLYAPVAVGAQEVAAGRVWKSYFTAAGNITFALQDGISTQLAMGKSTTVNDSPAAGYYTHTIAPKTQVAGAVPPLDSVTWHHEKHMDDASVLSVQFRGMKASNLRLICEQPRGYLLGQMGVLSKSRAKVAFSLTNTPALPATANVDPFNYRDMVVTYDVGEAGETDISQYIRGVQLEINSDLTALYENRETDPAAFLEGWRKQYVLEFQLIPYALDIWEELIATSNTKDVRIKWSRNSTYDYIQANLTDCSFTDHPITTPAVGTEELVTVQCEPRALTLTIVDKIGGTAYGES